MNQKVMQRLLLWILATFLIASACMKMWTGHSNAIMFSVEAYYFFAIVELVAGVAIIAGHSKLGILVSIGLAVVGVALALAFPDGHCGCLGRHIELSQQLHLMLSGSVGLVGALAWLMLQADGSPPGKEEATGVV